MSLEKHISFAETQPSTTTATKHSSFHSHHGNKSPNDLKRNNSTNTRNKKRSSITTIDSGHPSSTTADSKDNSPRDATTPTASPGLPSTSSVTAAQTTSQIPAGSTPTMDKISSFKSITSKSSGQDKGPPALVGGGFEKDFSFPVISQQDMVTAKPIIDVEANNAKSSYHLALLITAILSFFCLGFFSFIPFVVIVAKYHSSQSEVVKHFVSRSKWILVLILLGDMVLLLIAALIVVIVLFATGVFKTAA